MTIYNDKISIIMPAYNAEHYIASSIISVQAQTWNDWELIIINDCSTDRTNEIISTFTASDSRIIVLDNFYNLGAAQSRNKGIKYAQGKWIAFLDSDDCWVPEKLEHQLAYAYKKHASFIFTASNFMNENGELLNSYLSVPEQVNYQELLKQNVISCSSVLIKKELILPYPMELSECMHEDFAVWLKILKDNKMIAHGLNQPLLIYRISAASKSGNKVKAARMTFRVYRYIGLSLPLSIYNWLFYVKRSLHKYSNLK